MESVVTIKMGELHTFLLNTAPVAPVFIWGPPGVGKSAMVEQFAEELGMPCVSLLGSQLAPEDLIGVPRIEGEHSIFCPPRIIARTEPYVLFLDELNACSPDVQKAFYSLIHDRRLGEYHLPEGSVVIGAGNRASDSAIVRQMSSALINRLVHVGVTSDTDAWLEWALQNDIHPLVVEYIQKHPSHLWHKPPKEERCFSTPRAWHMFSNVLKSWSEDDLTPNVMDVLARGLLSASHAQSFTTFVKLAEDKFILNEILAGKKRWPRKPEERELLQYLAINFRDQLIKRLPQNKAQLRKNERDLAYNAIGLLRSLADIAGELAQLVITPDEQGNCLPDWYMAEIANDLPRLIAK